MYKNFPNSFPKFFCRKRIIVDEEYNIENVQLQHLGKNAYNITFTRLDNTLDTNDVVLTKVREVFVMTQQQRINTINRRLSSR